MLFVTLKKDILSADSFSCKLCNEKLGRISDSVRFDVVVLRKISEMKSKNMKFVVRSKPIVR